MPVRLPHRFAAAATVLAIALGASACAQTAPGADDTGPPRPGGTLRYGLSQAPTCADPAQSSSNQTIYVTRPIVDSLTDQDPATGALVPWLAQRWEVSPDSRRFTFTLRPGVTFSDGAPLDATAVARSFDSVVKTLGPVKAALGASYLSGYSGTTIVDPRTIVVEFARPNAQFLQATSTSQLGIVSPATSARSAAQRCEGEVAGTGPFVYTDYAQDRSATLEKRTGYSWGSSVAGHTGEPYLDRVEFTVVPESGVRTGSLASGQLDAISDALPQDRTIIEGAQGRVLTTPNPGITFGLQPNVSRGVLADPAVRVALLSAIDRQELVDTVLDTTFAPATSVLARNTPGYVRSPLVTFDRSRAEAQLDAAGWRTGRDGIRVKDGRRLSFGVTFSAVFAANQTVLELLQQQLRLAGIDMQLDLVSTPESVARQSNGKFDAFYYNSTRADGDILRVSFSTRGRNIGRAPAVPALEDAFTGELSTSDPAARARFIATAQQEILDNGFFIPTIELSQTIGQGSRAHGLRFDASARLRFDDTWVTPDSSDSRS